MMVGMSLVFAIGLTHHDPQMLRLQPDGRGAATLTQSTPTAGQLCRSRPFPSRTVHLEVQVYPVRVVYVSELRRGARRPSPERTFFFAWHTLAAGRPTDDELFRR